MTANLLPRLPQAAPRTQYKPVNPPLRQTLFAAWWAVTWALWIGADVVQTHYALTSGGYTEASPIPAAVAATFGLPAMLVLSALVCMCAALAPYAPWTRPSYRYAAWVGAWLVLLGKLAVVLSNWHQLSG